MNETSSRPQIIGVLAGVFSFLTSGVWTQLKFNAGGQHLALGQIEHDIIRNGKDVLVDGRNIRVSCLPYDRCLNDLADKQSKPLEDPGTYG
jgi:hypothetical protein